MNEQGVVFSSQGKQLIGIEHLPTNKSSNTFNTKGLVLVVGGPQTRVGSHRLFVHLARALAERGVTVFRFDYSGAGDSAGELTEFTAIQADIAAALTCFKLRNPNITEFNLWGLCDAASAILLYLQANTKSLPKDINKLVLINPWVRQEYTQAKVYLRSYYLKRLMSKDFWQKLLLGKVATKTAYTELQSFSKQGRNKNTVNTKENFVFQMLQGLRAFSGRCHILLSGNDLTADEFKVLVKSNKHWRQLMAQDNMSLKVIAKADHTFSQQADKHDLIALTIKALVE
jgi:exosortase A-associated hydrolase 1